MQKVQTLHTAVTSHSSRKRFQNFLRISHLESKDIMRDSLTVMATHQT
jgi:hypothetical protein